MTAILPIAAGVGVMYVLDARRSGALRSVIGQTPTEGATRAIAALPASVGAVELPRASNGSPLDTLKLQQRALVEAHGAVVSLPVAYPKMRMSELLALVDAWLVAYEAGRDVDADTFRDFALVKGNLMEVVAGSRIAWERAKAGESPLDPDALTDLGRYLFDLTTWRERVLRDGEGDDGGAIWGTVGDAGAGSSTQALAPTVVGTWDRLRRFVGGIEGVSYVFPWARPSEQDPLRHVPGAVGAAAGASGEFVAGVASDALSVAGQLVASVLRDPLMWVGGALLVGGVVFLVVNRAR